MCFPNITDVAIFYLLFQQLESPNVEVHCLHGYSVDTPAAFVFSSSTWYSHQPKVVTGDGDGTVNLRSLVGCLKWAGKQTQQVFHQTFEKAEHLSLLRNIGVQEYIAKVLSA